MAPLEVEADEQAAGTDGAAIDRAKARLELLVVVIETARAEIAAVELVAVAQFDVDRARDRVAGAARRRGADDLDPVDQFGGDAVEEEAAIVAVAGNAFAVDQDLGITRRQAAEARAVALDDVGQEGHRRHALQRVARGQRFEALEEFAVIRQHGFGLVAAIAVTDTAEDDNVLRRGDRSIAAVFGRDRRVLRRRRCGEESRGKRERGGGLQAENSNHGNRPPLLVAGPLGGACDSLRRAV